MLHRPVEPARLIGQVKIDVFIQDLEDATKLSVNAVMAFPILATISVNSWMSAEVVRKFTMHARSTNFSPMTAFETYASPLCCRRVKQFSI